MERLARDRVTRLFLVPSLLSVLLEAIPDLGARLPSLRVLVVSGEAFPPDLARRCLAALPGVRVVNELGATEYCAELAAAAVTEEPAGDVPVGRPLPGTELAVVTADGSAAPVGVAGELAVGGAALPRGYLGEDGPRPEHIVEHPLRPGVLLWRSGDLARWGSDGLLHHLGRVDRQLKIRGIRVEPGEVEAALRSHPDVADAAVVPVRAAGGTALAAHVAPAPGANPDPGDLRRHVASLLPAHMVPSRFAVAGELPRTASAKLDRAALAANGAEPAVRWRSPGGLEAQIAELFRELLELPQLPAADDDFFDLGGHSLLAVRLLARIEQRLGRRVTLAALIQAPTPAGLAAAAVENGAGGVRRSPLVEVSGDDGDVALFVVPGVWGLPVSARRLAALLEPRGPVYGFEALGHREGERPLETIEEIARTYAEEVQRVRGRRRVVLLGMCFGGHVAYETARALRDAGLPADRLIVFDVAAMAPAPRGWRSASARLRWLVGGVVFSLPRRWNRFRSHAGGSPPLDPEEADLLQVGDAAIDDRIVAVRRAHSVAWSRHMTVPLDADLVLFRTRKYAWQRLGWRPFVRRLRVVSLDVEHVLATTDGAAVTALALQEILDDVDPA